MFTMFEKRTLVPYFKVFSVFLLFHHPTFFFGRFLDNPHTRAFYNFGLRYIFVTEILANSVMLLSASLEFFPGPEKNVIQRSKTMLRNGHFQETKSFPYTPCSKLSRKGGAKCAVSAFLAISIAFV